MVKDEYWYMSLIKKVHMGFIYRRPVPFNLLISNKLVAISNVRFPLYLCGRAKNGESDKSFEMERAVANILTVGCQGNTMRAAPVGERIVKVIAEGKDSYEKGQSELPQGHLIRQAAKSEIFSRNRLQKDKGVGVNEGQFSIIIEF